MAGKGGKDLDIVTDMESLDAFNAYLDSKNGLVVCESYQDWAGPCMVMRRFFKKAKFDLLEGEDSDFVTFCSIKSDLVPAFEQLKGKSVPTYLFFGAKKLLHIFRGHEAGSLMPLIKEMVRREKACVAGKAKRFVLSESQPFAIPRADPVLPPFEVTNDSEPDSEPAAAPAPATEKETS